jgi:Raf kinase inhibitor-like YbhB/YbcL family protein
VVRIHVSSRAFEDGGTIPERCSRLGGNVSPPLSWSDVPVGTTELALVVQDPDAPSGTFTHWIVAGLTPDLAGLEEGHVPDGAVEGVNDFGEQGYGGPQPPAGDRPHRYVFTLVALEAESGLALGASIENFHAAVRGKELARGQLTGHYATRVPDPGQQAHGG